MKKIFFISLILTPFLQGCLPFVVGGAATSGIIMHGSDRSANNIRSDISAWTNIKNQYIQYNSRDLFKNVSVKVMEGRVLLTGNVSSMKTKILAEKIAWHPKTIIEVINEIEVHQNNFKSDAQDCAITMHVKTRLAMEYGIKSGNYKVETVNRVVYVIGTTKSQEELSHAIDLISHVNGVHKVVNYVVVRY